MPCLVTIILPSFALLLGASPSKGTLLVQLGLCTLVHSNVPVLASSTRQHLGQRRVDACGSGRAQWVGPVSDWMGK